MKSKMIENDVKTLFREYMGDLESRVAQTTGEMTHFMHVQRENVKKIANSRFNQNLKYHNQKFTLDSYITEHYSEFDKTISPFQDLFDEIMHKNDLHERYTYLNKFISKYTGKEDETWYKCVTTNTPLVPKFLQMLGSAYLVTDNYEQVMNDICFKEGKMSDDGSKWVHKDSGYMIKEINFDADEGYDDNGMRSSSQEVVEEDDPIEDVNLNDLSTFVYSEEDVDQNTDINTSNTMSKKKTYS